MVEQVKRHHMINNKILSDERLKKNINRYNGNATDLIDSIEIVEYEWKTEEDMKQYMAKEKMTNKKLLKATQNIDSGKKIGVVAQKLMDKFPECVWGNENEGYRS